MEIELDDNIFRKSFKDDNIVNDTKEKIKNLKEIEFLLKTKIKNPFEDKINSTEFNINFEKVFQEKLNKDYKVTLYGVYNLKEKRINEFKNSDIIIKYIQTKLKIIEKKVNVIEYQSSVDTILDKQLENGGIEINIKYNDISLLNYTILLDDYEYGATIQDKEEFIKDFITKMERNYLNYLSHIFETMTESDK
jgi:hypothetical protein